MFSNKYKTINEYRDTFSESDESFSSPLIKFPNYGLDNFNQTNSIYEDNKLNNINHIPSNYSIIQAEIKKKSISKRTKLTSTKTNNKKEENDEPLLFTPYDIINIFNKESNKDTNSDNFKSLKFSENIEDDLQLTRNKRKIDYFVCIYNQQ